MIIQVNRVIKEKEIGLMLLFIVVFFVKWFLMTFWRLPAILTTF